jgi:hypothetical protein
MTGYVYRGGQPMYLPGWEGLEAANAAIMAQRAPTDLGPQLDKRERAREAKRRQRERQAQS